MRKNRGLKLRRKLLLRLFNFNWIFHRKNLSGYRRIDSSGAQPANSGGGGSKLFNWGRLLRRRAKELFFLRFQNHNRGYIRVGTEPYYDEREGGEGKRAVEVPKGHLAVCVGEREEEAHKVVVPIIYLNHPLFGELLKEAEEEYGFDHAGQIMLPCPMSKFQTVQMRISAGEKCARSTPPHRPPLPRHHHRV